MSKVATGKQAVAEMTEGHSVDAAAPSRSDSSVGDSADNDRKRNPSPDLTVELQYSYNSSRRRGPAEVPKEKNSKPRFGLPEGFVSRLNRYGRTVLFEDNVYRLPTGAEFIPQLPSGTLGARNHQYALLTLEQYEKRERGSVYVRSDGRIFNYAFDHGALEREIFDTGFTIQDLERTGRYAPELKLKAKSSRKVKTKSGRRKRKQRSRT